MSDSKSRHREIRHASYKCVATSIVCLAALFSSGLLRAYAGKPQPGAPKTKSIDAAVVKESASAPHQFTYFIWYQPLELSATDHDRGQLIQRILHEFDREHREHKEDSERTAVLRKKDDE